MKIYNDLKDTAIKGCTAVALGNFDGIHLGHQNLIKLCVKRGRKKSYEPTVFTFSNHPKDLIWGAEPVKNILHRREKEGIIASLGVDNMVNIPFTEEIMTMSPQDFVKNILVDNLKAKSVFCGFNYNFGYKGTGNTELLSQLGEKYGFEVNVMKPFIIEDNLVSSTFIRTLISSGQVNRCKTYLGRNYYVSGKVIVGNRLGRTIGFPTSNINMDDSMVSPPNGVYITFCNYNGIRYPSITNVGVKPTVGVNKKNVETHIFNFNKEIYGKNIIVEFLLKVRDEVKFDCVEHMAEQIKRDCLEARNFFERGKGHEFEI